MPRFNSFAEVLTDLERLLAAADTNAAALPGLDVVRAPLEAVIADLRSISGRRNTLNADKQVLSADLKAAMQRGRDTGSQFRSFARAHIGMRSEKMVEFRVPVQRLGVPRKRRNQGGGNTDQPAPQPPLPTTPPASEGGATG